MQCSRATPLSPAWVASSGRGRSAHFSSFELFVRSQSMNRITWKPLVALDELRVEGRGLVVRSCSAFTSRMFLTGFFGLVLRTADGDESATGIHRHVVLVLGALTVLAPRC